MPPANAVADEIVGMTKRTVPSSHAVQTTEGEVTFPDGSSAAWRAGRCRFAKASSCDLLRE